MPLPIFRINNHDYTEYVQELKPSRNDLDKDGSGRNILNGLMYRTRIATKLKYNVAFCRLTPEMLQQLESDMDSEFVSITMLVARSNAQETRTYYTSTINEGVQRSIDGNVYYDGVNFDITER